MLTWWHVFYTSTYVKEDRYLISSSHQVFKGWLIPSKYFIDIQEHMCVYAVPTGGSRRHLILCWATSHLTVVNMPCADAPESEGLIGGEGKAWGHEDQLNSDCTTGEGTKNILNPPVLQPTPQRMLDTRQTVCDCPHRCWMWSYDLCLICTSWCCNFMSGFRKDLLRFIMCFLIAVELWCIFLLRHIWHALLKSLKH